MNGKQLYDVGARLLGVWFIVNGIAGVSTVFRVFSPSNADFFNTTDHNEKALWASLGVADQVILIVSGLVLQIRHPVSGAAQVSLADPTTLLAAGVRLLGLALAVPAAILAVVALALFAQSSTSGWIAFVQIMKPVLTCAAGLFLLLRPDAVVRLIMRAGAARMTVGINHGHDEEQPGHHDAGNENR